LAFSEDNSGDWQCLDTQQYRTANKSNDLVLYSAKVNHFTTFAILFAADTTFKSCQVQLFYTYLAIGFISSMAILVLLLMLLYLRNKRFQSYIHGDIGMRISEAENRVMREQKPSFLKPT
jgi:hypothetical protein